MVSTDSVKLLPISVIIPTYRRARLTAQAVLSVYRQTVLPREILVIDDGSGPEYQYLEWLCRELRARFASEPQAAVSLRLTTLSRNSAMPGAVRNVGMRTASQTWLAFLDSDDVWLPHKLELQWRRVAETGAKILHCRELWLRFSVCTHGIAGKSSTAGLSSVESLLIQRLKSLLGSSSASLRSLRPLDLARLLREILLPAGLDARYVKIVSQKKQRHLREGRPRELWPHALRKCILGPSTLLMQRSVCSEVGYFAEHIQIAEDYEYFLRLMALHAVAYSPDYLVVKRDNIANVGAAGATCNFPQLSHKYKCIEPFRLEALQELLCSPVAASLLSGEQRRSAIAELLWKLEICLAGAQKRLAAAPPHNSQLNLHQEICRLTQCQDYWRQIAAGENCRSRLQIKIE